MRHSDDEQLDALFQAYRAACPGPEASANFMPGLWKNIEARQCFSFSFGRMASAFVTAALALSFALGVYLAVPHGSASYSLSYVETLDAQENVADFLEPVRLEVR
jgi:hypothetical protein